MFGPTGRDERITNLDVLRGIATMGTFYISAVAYGLPHAAFFNLQSPETNAWYDWLVAVIGELFFDQKAMALLALLYGAGVARFASRATDHGATARWVSLRRSLLLLGLGVPVGMHGLLWEGTSLWFFAAFTPVLLLLRNRSLRLLIGLGATGVVFSTLLAFEFHPETEQEAATLGQYWVTGSHGVSDMAGAFMFLGTVSLLSATMVVGLAVGRLGLLHADPEGRTVRRMTRFGLGIGLPLAAASLAWRVVGDFEPDVAIIAEAPNTLATIPLTLGYVGLITRWQSSGSLAWIAERIRAVGQMALSNSVAQTMFGIFVLRDYGFGRGAFSRSGLVVVVALVWTVQLITSKPWLDRFQYGPLEWVLRSVVYRRRLPIIRDTRTPRAEPA